MSLDRTFYIVICRTPTHDRTLADVLSREETIRDILVGQIENVHRVSEFNPATGLRIDVSKDFARDLAARLDPGEPVRADLRDFIESHCGVGTVLRAAA